MLRQWSAVRGLRQPSACRAMVFSAACSKVTARLPRGSRALGERSPVVERLGAGVGEGDDGVGAEADHDRPAVDVEALAPTLAGSPVGRGLDEQAEAVAAAAVAVAAGMLDLAHECGAEPAGPVHCYPPGYYIPFGMVVEQSRRHQL